MDKKIEDMIPGRPELMEGVIGGEGQVGQEARRIAPPEHAEIPGAFNKGVLDDPRAVVEMEARLEDAEVNGQAKDEDDADYSQDRLVIIFFAL